MGKKTTKERKLKIIGGMIKKGLVEWCVEQVSTQVERGILNQVIN